MMLTATAEALFVSAMQPSDHCNRAEVDAAVDTSLLAYGGEAGCAQRLAAEFGEHPETAVPRMRWALWAVAS